MNTRVLTVAIAASALLSACATGGGSGQTSTAGGQVAVCDQIAALSLSGKRKSFGLDFASAERDFRNIVSLYEDQVDGSCRGGMSKLEAQMNLGLALSSQQQFRLAEASFQAAEASLNDQPRKELIFQYNSLLAQHELNKENAAAAINFAANGVSNIAADAEFYGKDSLFTLSLEEQTRLTAGARALYSKSYADLLSERNGDANASIWQAIRLVADTAGVPESMVSRLQVHAAVIALQQNKVDDAIKLARAASTQLDDELPRSALTARAKVVLGAALVEAERYDEAHEAYASAFDDYETNPNALRYETIWPFVRLHIREAGGPVIRDQAAVARIFRAAQLVRTPGAASDIAATAAAFAESGTLAGEAVRLWREAEEEFFRLKAALTQRERLLPDQVNNLLSLLSEADDREAQLRVRRDEIAPTYRAAIETPVGLEDVRATLRSNEAMVHIVTGDLRSLVIYIDREVSIVRAIRFTDGAFAQLVDILRGSIGVNGRYQGFDINLSRQLTAAIFGEEIDRVMSKERVYVATNGALQNLPFSILATDGPEDQTDAVLRDDYTGVRWLADDVRVSYVPRPRNLVDIRQRAGRSAGAKPMLAFGDFKSDVTVEGVMLAASLPPGCADTARVLAGVPPLPQTRVEVERAVAAIGEGAEMIVGEAFTEDRIAALSDSGELSDYRVLHFATHGVLWRDSDCFSEPALTTSVNGDGGDSDGLLTASDIRSLSLDADLVVLSACQTADATGQIGVGGENLSSIARSFFAAGARSVVATHWVVSDEATADLMSDMYERLGRSAGISPGEALADAQAAMRARPDRSHPFFWAAFVLIGDGAGSDAGAKG